MPLYHDTGVSVENWVEMKRTVAMKYEVDHCNDTATLFFGGHDTYVLNVSQENLAQIIQLGSKALADLKVSARPGDED